MFRDDKNDISRDRSLPPIDNAIVCEDTPMPKKQGSPIPWGSAKESKQIIIDAAVKCFEQYGPQRTSMDDIAKAAGISRKTLYRVFSDRPKLIQEILQQRWVEIAMKTQSRIAKAASFEEALLEGSVTAISAAQNDKLANDIIHKATDHTMEQFLLYGNERVYEANQDIWLAAIVEGRQQGVVKPNLSDDRIIEIIKSMHVLLLMRDDSPAKQRAFLKDVLIPAITVAQVRLP